MLRLVAIALAATSRFNAASVRTDAPSFGHVFGHSNIFRRGNIFGQGRIFGHQGLGGKEFGPRRLVDSADRRPCEDRESRTVMTGRFPAPWRIVEIANGFVVSDAAGQQLGVFYGRADPNSAGHTGCVTLDEARAFAADFAMLPERLNLDLGS